MDGPARRRFEGFELDLRTGELRTEDGPVPLERQPARALVVLVTNAGRLVARDELCAAIWPAGTHVDFEHGLNYCLRQIRAALGDHARRPRFIETIPRQGYRFIAALDDGSGLRQVAVNPSGSTGGPADRRPLAAARWRGLRRRLPMRASTAMTAAAVLLVLALIEAGPRNEDHHRLAVAVARTVHDLIF